MYAVLWSKVWANCIKGDCWLEYSQDVYVRVFRDLEDAKNFAKKVYKDGAEFAIIVPVLASFGIEIEGELIEC